MKKKKIGLLPKIVIAIALGIACGLFFPGKNFLNDKWFI